MADATCSQRVLDTFSAFLRCWQRLRSASGTKGIDIWLEYMRQFPELLEKQLSSYREDGEDWRSIAAERVFPLLARNFAKMNEAHANLPAVIDRVAKSAFDLPNFPESVSFIIYVGIGCGAGWATTYEKEPAVLLGLEKIAECGWESPSSIESILGREHLTDCFAVIVGAEDAPSHKPDPSGLLLAVSRLGCLPQEVVYVGDHPVDAQAAYRAGIPFVATLTGVSGRERFTGSQSLAIIDDLSALPDLLGVLST